MIVNCIQTEIEGSLCILKVTIMGEDSTYASVLLSHLNPNLCLKHQIFITFDDIFMTAQTASNDLLASQR